MKNYLPKDLEQKILKILKKYCPKDTEFILFGSFTSGKYTDKSDIDVAIKGQQPLDTAIWTKIEEAFEESDITRKVDVLDFYRVKKEFQEVINKTGINLK